MLPLLDWTREYPNAYYLASFASVYLAYYVCYIVKKPHLACNDKFQNFLLGHCPVFSEKYYPTIWCFESTVMTLVRAFLKSKPPVPYKKEFLHIADGGHVALDWARSETSPYPEATQPTVILLPGLTGSSEESYMRHWATQVITLGYRAVVFNNRGNGGAELKTPRTYCASKTDDLQAVIQHVHSRYPDAPLMAAGVSLGGLIVSNYVAETGDDSLLIGALTCSAPWNVFESAKSLETPMNCFVFNKRLCQNLKDNVKRYEYLFKDQVDLEKVYQSNTIREFDESFIAKQFGYASHKEYYAASCIHNKIDKIKIPLLALNAADDMFSPEIGLPLAEATQSEHVAIAMTPRGGHIGFCEGLIPHGTSLMDRVFAQYIDAIFQYGDSLTKTA